MKHFIFVTKFSRIFLLNGKHSFGKVINELWYQVCDLMRFIQQTHIYILHQTHEYHLSHTVGKQMIVEKPNVFFPFARQMPLNLVTKFDFIWIVSCSWSNHIILLLMFVAEKVLLLLVIYLTDLGMFKQLQRLSALSIMSVYQKTSHPSPQMLNELPCRVMSFVWLNNVFLHMI